MFGQILAAIGLLLLVLVAVVVVVLCLPWRVSADLRSGHAARVRIRIAGVSLPLSGTYSSPKEAGDASKPRKHHEGHKKRRKQGRRTGLSKAQWRRLISSLPYTLRQLRAAIHIEKLSANGRVGLGDPALTGQFYGMISALKWSLLPGQEIHLAPDFDATGFHGEAVAALRFTPMRLVMPLAGLGLKVGLMR